MITIRENECGIACYYQGDLLGEAAVTPVTGRLIARFPDGSIEETNEVRWLVDCLAWINIDKRTAVKLAQQWRDETSQTSQRWLNGDSEDRYADVTLSIFIESEEAA